MIEKQAMSPIYLNFMRIKQIINNGKIQAEIYSGKYLYSVETNVRYLTGKQNKIKIIQTDKYVAFMTPKHPSHLLSV